jgi:RNase P/RNase MRP subunit p29
LTETIIKFTSPSEVKPWLEDKTNSIISPVHTQAKKLRDDMNVSIQSVADVSKLLLDNSTREIERRNMKVYNRARALNKLAHLFVDRLKKLETPEEISYDSLSKYAQEIQKVFIVFDIDIKNWFPRISPFFIMDRRRFLTVYEKTKQTHTLLNDFITKEYVKTKTLEEAFNLLNELQNVQQQQGTIGDEKEQIKNERLPIEKEIAELEQKIDELKTKGPIDSLNMANSEICNLTNELKHSLRYLQKPFIKMQALATSGGGGGVTPDQLSRVNQYLDAPFDAFLTEQNGYPELREILEKLQHLLAEDKLKLKEDKARKAEQSINEIVKNDSLIQLQARCVEMANRRDQLLASPVMDETKRCLAVYQQQLDQLKMRKTSIETHEAVKENAYNDTSDRIGNLKRTIEKDIYNSIDIKVQIP